MVQRGAVLRWGQGAQAPSFFSGPPVLLPIYVIAFQRTTNSLMQWRQFLSADNPHPQFNIRTTFYDGIFNVKCTRMQDFAPENQKVPGATPDAERATPSPTQPLAVCGARRRCFDGAGACPQKFWARTVTAQAPSFFSGLPQFCPVLVRAQPLCCCSDSRRTKSIGSYSWRSAILCCCFILFCLCMCV